MNDKKFSDEFINAFADNQLAPEEKSHAYPIISGDPELNRRVCEVRKIRDLIQLAYKEPPLPQKRRQGPASWRPSLRVAAVLLLSVGAAMGWGLHNLLSRNTQTTVTASGTAFAVPAQTHTSRVPVHTLPARDGEARIVLHLSRGDTDRMREVLDEAENLLTHYADIKQPARIELIANGPGLNLLRAETSPFATRIRDMQQRYENLTFAACQNTIDRIYRDTGVHAHLLPEAVVIDSGVAEIILLQQQGWAYIQV